MFDELFEESKHKRRPDHYGYNNAHDRHGRGHDDHNLHGHYNPLLNIAQKILRNKALLVGIGLIVAIICVLAVWLISAVVPYLGQIIPLLEKQGLKGVVDTVMLFAQKIWEGSGK